VVIYKIGLIGLISLLAACPKAPDIQGEWFFDYEQTKLAEFPNIYYESARELIADVEPRYGVIKIKGDTVVLGGAVCKILRINDRSGLSCTERNQSSLNGFYYENNRLIVQPQGQENIRLIFSRNRQDPEKLYGIDLSKKPFEENPPPADQISVPSSEHKGFLGVARTVSFDVFYDPASVSNEGRLTHVAMLLNYLEPLNQTRSAIPALSSVQFITFDCPASNYRITRYVMYSGSNASGAVLSDSGILMPDPNWVAVPENSVNKSLYMRVCH